MIIIPFLSFQLSSIQNGPKHTKKQWITNLQFLLRAPAPAELKPNKKMHIHATTRKIGSTCTIPFPKQHSNRHHRAEQLNELGRLHTRTRRFAPSLFSYFSIFLWREEEVARVSRDRKRGHELTVTLRSSIEARSWSSNGERLGFAGAGAPAPAPRRGTLCFVLARTDKKEWSK